MASGSASKAARVHSRNACPGRSRPARPARCAALARLTGAASRASSPVRGLYARCFTWQASTTKTTPSSVTDVSAMLVATTTCAPEA